MGEDPLMADMEPGRFQKLLDEAKELDIDTADWTPTEGDVDRLKMRIARRTEEIAREAAAKHRLKQAEVHISQRPLTVKEWERRLTNAEKLLANLEVEVARLIVMVDRAGDATGVEEQQRLSVIHSAHGKLGHLKGAMQLARRRIEKGLV